MQFTIISLFPEMFESVFNHSILKRAREDGFFSINYINLREFGVGKHKSVDDTPYGGGVGMVLKVDVVDQAITFAKSKVDNSSVILLDPTGTQYTQKFAENLSRKNHLIFVCGHYEGFDERIKQLVDYEISIGDYILSGGEIPAMVILESVGRLLPGVLKKENATFFESFSEIDGMRILEFPQYTRPHVYKGMSVPEILLSGNQKVIDEYRKSKAKEITIKKRPDIMKK